MTWFKFIRKYFIFSSTWYSQSTYVIILSCGLNVLFDSFRIGILNFWQTIKYWNIILRTTTVVENGKWITTTFYKIKFDLTHSAWELTTVVNLQSYHGSRKYCPDMLTGLWINFYIISSYCFITTGNEDYADGKINDGNRTYSLQI